MKYIVVLGDGMADWPVKELDGKTPLDVAVKPNIDKCAREGLVGMVKTVPDGMKPGSDTANLSVMGYDPKECYSGRSPLEAASIGVDLNPEDVTYRCNMVMLSGEEDVADTTMMDYCAGEISTAEADELISALREEIAKDGIELYTGVSYRHCLVLRDAETGADLTPPHDISLKPVRDYLPKGTNSELLLSIINTSRRIFKDHPVNLKRIAEGKHPATSVWFWGEGRKPSLKLFEDEYGLKGAVISAVDLIKGIAICAGMDSIDVEGATGNVDTNFKGKAMAAVKALRDGADYVYIHMEAPDECGHRHEVDNKILSIEKIDSDVVRVIKEEMAGEDYSMMILTDHPTPIEVMTHVSDPVPFVIYRSGKVLGNGAHMYSEKEGEKTGLFFESGPALLKYFLTGEDK